MIREWTPRRLILSRKGFDSANGGIPSPIVDGRLLPLPFPPRRGDNHTMRDLGIRDIDFEGLLRDLGGRRGYTLDTPVHLDPDLEHAIARPRPALWRPAFGQTSAAQSHLAREGVGAGDVFLFFGWFREAETIGGRWRFVRGAPHLHVIFGWLEVGEVLALGRDRDACLRAHPWIGGHTHLAGHDADAFNTLYIAPARSRIVSGRPGGGKFARYSDALRLTAPGRTRRWWQLPAWFEPNGRKPLTYHRAEDWHREPGGAATLRSAAIGQEFVLDVSQYPEAIDWMLGLIAAGAG